MPSRSGASRWAPLLVALLAGCGGGGNASPMPGMPGSGGVMPTDMPTMIATAMPTASPTPSATPTAAQVQPAATAVPASVYTAGPPDVAIPTATRPAQFDPSTPISSLGAIAAPNDAAMLSKRMIKRKRQSAAGANNHETIGVYLTDTTSTEPPLNAAYANQTAYEASQSPMLPQIPVPTNQEDTLYAPTFHFGTCFENSTAYYYYNGALTANLTVYNFCANPTAFVFSTPINATLIDRYIRIDPTTKRQSYNVEIFTPDAVPTANSTWYSIIYDYMTQQWDEIVSTSANGNGPQAYNWSYFENYMQPGACALSAPASSSGDAVHDTITGTWKLYGPGVDPNISIDSELAQVAPSCYIGDSTGGPTYLFTQETNAANWDAYSLRMP